IAATVRSAALLAIGGFLALTLLPGGDTADPSAQGCGPGNDTPCRRHDVAAARAESRSPAEIRALIASCAACHDHLQNADRADRRQSVFDPHGRQLLAMTFVTFGLL
ncbi:MAG TPA: hypothetical protein VL475_03755, partial [Planctomycetaceae bacterium]|nr:hypothetical protein [Planctomycetaceae bacterium]